MERSNFSLTHQEGEIMAIITMGSDLAKNAFAVHRVDETGKPVLVGPADKRDPLLELVANLPPCFVGMNSLTSLSV
jgi:transposase